MINFIVTLISALAIGALLTLLVEFVIDTIFDNIDF